MSSVLEVVGGKIAAGHPLTFEDVQSLVAVTDLVRLGMLADEARRRRHGARATFVRVVDVACDAAETAAWPATTGEVRITGIPASPDAALDHARAVTARANGTPVSAYSLADLEHLAGDVKALTAPRARTRGMRRGGHRRGTARSARRPRGGSAGRA